MEHKIVSSESEKLILVNEQDQEIGVETKGNCHDGDGILHRAFSLILFNSEGEMLIQQRAKGKRLWPMFWSNTCCSHPREGETMEIATNRRLEQELGMTSNNLKQLFKFQYQASFEDKGSEHELCSVYIGTSSDPVLANDNEIEAWRFVSIDDLEKELIDHPEQFTPWFKMEWERIKKDHQDDLKSLGIEI